MPRFTPQQQTFLGGLNTRASPAGLPLGQHEVVKNTRFNEGAAARRKGMQRLDACTRSGDAIVLNPDGTDATAYIDIPLNTDVHALPTAFTIDIVVNPDELPGTGDDAQILGFEDGEDALTLLWTIDNTIKFTMTDTGSTQYTLESSATYDVTSPDTSIPIRIVRDGSTLTMLVAGTSVASSTALDASLSSEVPTSNLQIGSSLVGTGGETGFSGVVDDLRIFHVPLSGHQHAWTEWADPRYPRMVAYYRFDEQTDTGWEDVLFDDSRYGNHGTAVGGVSFQTPGLVEPLEPVVGIHQFQHSSGTRRVLIAAGEALYESKVI